MGQFWVCCRWLVVCVLPVLGLSGCWLFSDDSDNSEAAAPPAAIAPSISSQPAALTVAAGQTASFSVTSAGSAPLAYQWRRNGVNITGATASSYSFTPALADDGVRFSVTVSNSAGSLTSSEAVLTVQAVVTLGFSSPPQNVAVTVGQSATFSATATVSPVGTALAYQWLRNGTEIAGATAASWTSPALALADNGARFSLRVTAGTTVLVSTEATLTVAAPVAAAVSGLVATASNYALGLVNTGEVLAWGDGSNGGFGSGTAVAGSAARRVPVPASRHVSAGEVNALAVGQDGRVRGWGLSGPGALGTFNQNITTPTELPGGINDAVAALTLDTRVLALRTDGSVSYWPGTMTIAGANVQPLAVAGLGNVRKLVRLNSTVRLGTADVSGALALREDGSVWQITWGAATINAGISTSPASATAVAGLSGITELACSTHCLALRSDGTVLAWGDNQERQLGTGGTASNTSTAAAVRELSGIRAVAALSRGSVALGQDGRVWAWGAETHGQRSAGTLGLPTPLALPLGALAVSANSAFAHLLLADGSVWCWGANGSCNTGVFASNVPERAAGISLMPSSVLITTAPAAARVAVGQSVRLSVVASGSGALSYSWLRDGSVLAGANGASLDTAPLALADEGSRWAVRVADGAGSTVSADAVLGVTPTATTPERPARVLAHQLYEYRGAAGTHWAWGDGSPAAVGSAVAKVWRRAGSYNATGGAALAVTVQGAPLALGGDHSCALAADGGVLCWGRNHHGQLGDGSTTDREGPQAVPGLTGATALVAGADFSCALRADASVACWGRNSSGQLGDGSLLDRSVPTVVTGLSDVVALAAGDFHACALQRSGAVLCWGNNTFGSLGDGGGASRSSPTPVSGLVAGAPVAVVALAAGNSASCAIKADGTLWCWGTLGGVSAAGFGASLPTAVAGLADVVSVSLGSGHACALRLDRRVLCWGDNSNGRLGDGTATARTVPTLVSGLLDAVTVSAGSTHSCALRLAGGVLCWGATGDGAVGDGPAESLWAAQGPSVLAPRGVFGSADAAAVSAGRRRSCALLGSGGMVCWGSASYGALGDGQPDARHFTPVPVRGGPRFWK